MLIVDGSDFRKQGKMSVGVARQWCGELGKRAHCQAGVFVAYASEQGACLVHRALYLPRPWAEDPAWAERRRRCRVPAAVPFRTKPQLAAALLGEVVASGHLPARWVTCDEAYGQDPAFLDAVADLGLGYCAEVPHSTRVWTEAPATHVPPAPAHGRPPTRTRLVPGAPRARAVRQVAAQQPASAWQRLTLQQGSHGPLQAEFCARRVVAVREGLPGPEVWLLLRRHPRHHELKTYLCHAPAAMPLAALAHLAGRRWPIESCFQEGKQNVGLGDYEGRRGQGWHRHMTLCLLAYFFLVRQATRLKKNAPPDRGPGGRRAPHPGPTSRNRVAAGTGPAGLPQRAQRGRHPFPQPSPCPAALTSRCSTRFMRRQEDHNISPITFTIVHYASICLYICWASVA